MTIANLLEPIKTQSLSFQGLVDTENWEMLAKKLRVRQSELERIFESPLDPQDKQLAITFIQELQAIDQTIAMQINAKKTDIGIELAEFTKQNNAAKSYDKISKNTA